MSFGAVVEDKRCLVVMGPGGVGKTSLAAALGLQAAVRGKTALVLTVDPAMRLAAAMGLGDIPPGDHHRLSAGELERQGVPARAALHVAMLDTGKSLEALVRREVDRPERRRPILEHPFFRRLGRDLAGSREYAAMEELYHLYLRSNYDLLVVDTPPTIFGLDFLQAPERLLEVLEYDSYRWLMRPALLTGKLGLKVLDFSGGYVVRTLSRFTGIQFLRELASFIDLFSGLMEGFRQRAAALRTILSSDTTAFILVTTTAPGPADECLYLCRRLRSRQLAPHSILVNRITPAPEPLPQGEGWRAGLESAIAAARPGDRQRARRMLRGMEEAHRVLAQLAERDRRRLDGLRETVAGRWPLLEIPLLDQDVHDIAGLERLRRSIFAPGGPP